MTTGWAPDEPLIPSEEYVKSGYVTVDKHVWNLFFIKTPLERRQELIDEAERIAREEHGNEAKLSDPHISSQWSPYSLLLCLDLAGFVERGILRADVVVPAPPPPPPPPPPPEPEPEPEPKKIVVVSFPVTPTERYNDSLGYIGLEYLTPVEVKQRIKIRLDKREADPEDYDREYADVPDGGHVLVHIGRQELMDANTLWYRYAVRAEGEVVFEKKGKEGIPNVKGRDGNWWNVVTIPLKKPIVDSISVTVTDTKAERTYEFEVTREEQIL